MINELHIKNQTLITVRKAAAGMLFIAHLALAILFINGVSDVPGVTLGFWTAIELILGVLKSLGVSGLGIYNFLVRIGLSVTYIVLLVLIIKRIFLSFNDFRKALSENDLEDEKQQDRILCLVEDFGTSFFNIIAFIVISRLCSAFSLNKTAIITFAVGITVYCIARFSFFLCKNKVLFNPLFGLATDLIFVVSVLLFLTFCSTTTVVELFNSVKYVSHSVSSLKGEFLYAIIIRVVQPIFKILLCILGLKLLNNIYSYSDNRGSEYENVKSIFKFSVILAALTVLITGYKFGVSGMGTLLEFIIPNFSIVALAVVGRLVFTFPKYHVFEEKKNNTSVQNNTKNFYDRDDLVNLTIPDNVKMLDDYAYMDKSEINSVIIPKTVIIMGKGVFSGCGGLNDIYCESVYKPENWDNDWLDGCFATVHWGYKADADKKPNENTSEPEKLTDAEDNSVNYNTDNSPKQE